MTKPELIDMIAKMEHELDVHNTECRCQCGGGISRTEAWNTIDKAIRRSIAVLKKQLEDYEPSPDKVQVSERVTVIP